MSKRRNQVKRAGRSAGRTERRGEEEAELNPPGDSSPAVRWVTTVGLALVAIATIGLVVYVRLRLASIPLERDEGEYAYAGQLILDGLPPYSLAYNMKFPGTYYAYAGLMSMFGQTAWGIRVGLMCWHLATMAVVFELGRRLVGHLAAGLGVCAFAMLALDYWSMGVFAHATHFVLLPAMAGLLVLHVAMRTERAWLFVASGFLMGVAIIMKQQALFFGLATILIAMWSARGPIAAAVWRRGALVVVGVVAALALLVGLMAAYGVLDRFWFWTFQYGLAYVSETTWAQGMYVLRIVWGFITQFNAWLWYAGIAGIACLLVMRWTRGSRLFLSVWLVASALAITPGLYFRPHYFILLMPIVGLLVGVAAASLDRLAAPRIGALWARVAALAAFAGLMGSYVQGQSRYLFRMDQTELMRNLYEDSPFLESLEVARYIEAHTTPEDRIVVLGSEPQIYFYARRKSATGYLYTYSLMEPQPFAGRMQDEMRREVEAVKPLYLVLLDLPSSWGSRPGSDTHIIQWAADYATRCYDRVGIAEMTKRGGTGLFWDANLANFKPSGKPFMMTLRRRTGAGACASGP